MLDKQLITTELKNIFKLLHACFDVTALLELTSKQGADEESKEKPTNWNTLVMNLIDGKAMVNGKLVEEGKPYPNLKKDFEQLGFNSFFENTVRKNSKGYPDIREIANMVFIQLFMPRISGKPSQLEFLSEKKEGNKDFGINDIENLLKSKIALESSVAVKKLQGKTI